MKLKKFLAIVVISIFLFLAVYFTCDMLSNAITLNNNLIEFKTLFALVFSIMFVFMLYIIHILLEKPMLIGKNIKTAPQAKILEIFDLLDDEVIITDTKELKFTYLNQSLLSNCLYKKSDLMGKGVSTLYSDDCIEKIKGALQKLIQQEQDCLVLELTRKRKNGTTYQALVKLKYYNETNTLISVGHDITEEKESFSNTNHDIRTSLTKISGALKIILSGMVGEVPITMSEMLNLANTNALELLDKMNELITPKKS